MKTCKLIKEHSKNSTKLGNILKGVEIRVKARAIPGIRIISDEKQPYRRYDVRVKRNGREIFFEYSGSVNDYQEEKSPDKYRELSGLVYSLPGGEHLAYDILCCMGSDGLMDVSSLESFCSNFGYNPDSKKDTELYIECVEQHEKIRSLFSEDELITFPR